VAEWDWVEAVGPTVEKAVQAAVEDLGLESTKDAEIEVIQEGKGGFLGMGGQDAIVRVRAKAEDSGRRRSRGGRSGRSGRSSGSRSSGQGSGARSSGGGRSDSGSPDKSTSRGKGGGNQQAASQPRSRDDRSDRGQRRRPPQQKEARSQSKEDKMEVEVDRTAQAEMVRDFLEGLLGAFGLEGSVTCTVEEDMLIADVAGEQTEGLVGSKGATLQAIHELCRTIVQRKSQAGARLRLDIAGYQARRREALRIYTGRLVEKVVAEGGEVMLEPMNPAERKVVHDAAAELGGVRTFSEGEEPNRSVVIAKEDD
jgi:spoIIIJ-associated protein